MACEIIKFELNNKQFSHKEGHCWKIKIPDGINQKLRVNINLSESVIPCHYPKDIVSILNSHKDKIFLYENDVGLNPDNSSINDIIQKGSGKYIFDNDILYFSTSDHKKPQNKKYHVIVFTKDGISDDNFSFGVNWFDYTCNFVNEHVIQEAGKNIDEWLNKNGELAGKSVIDVGCGSGLSSLCLIRRNVKELVSFDIDPNCLKATQKLAELFAADTPKDIWKIQRGSILDDEYINNLGQFDIVHSWGVLHHTGNMWKAIENAIKLVKDDGLLFITLYSGISTYEKDWTAKKNYNQATRLGKINYIADYIMLIKHDRQCQKKDPDAWNTMQSSRGMSVYNDVVDWLGGFPYEVTNTKTIVNFCNKFNLTLVKCNDPVAQACHEWLFKKTSTSNV